MLLDRKARQFSHLYDGMQFSDLSPELSIRFGSALEPNAKKIECEPSEIEQIMLPLLPGRMFHVTKEETFEEICGRGWVDSKQQTQLDFAPR